MRFAVIGCGRAGQRHAQQYLSLAEHELVGCYDADAGAAEAFAERFGARPFRYLGDLLGGDLDGVSVCTPPRPRIDVIETAVERGVAVLSEKPLARRLEDCVGVPPNDLTACAFKFRHLAGTEPLRRLIAAGELGRILLVRATALSNVEMDGTWFSDPGVSGGGVLIDNGIHLIDLCSYLLGPIEAVQAQQMGSSRGLEVEESASIQLHVAGGARCEIFVSWEAPAPMPPLLQVYGSEGYAELGYELDVRALDGSPRLRVGADGVDVWNEVIRDFVTTRGSGERPRATFVDGYAALATVDAAYRSVDSGEWEEPLPVPPAWQAWEHGAEAARGERPDLSLVTSATSDERTQ